MREPAHPPKKAFRLRNETFIRILLTAPRRKNSQKAAFATAILHIHAVFLQEKENIYAFYARKGGSGGCGHPHPPGWTRVRSGFVACTEQTVHLHRATGLPARSIHPAPAGEKTACRNVFPDCKHFAIPPSTSGLAASRFKKIRHTAAGLEIRDSRASEYAKRQIGTAGFRLPDETQVHNL